MGILLSLLLYFSFAQNTTLEKPAESTETESSTVHGVVRRIAVFPLAVEENRKEADAAWWTVREFLASTQRFLVATKRLMSQKDVFQPRKALPPTDVILLAKILDADCVISTYKTNDSLKMAAYSGSDGFLLWENSIAINPSLPVGKQLESVSLKLVRDFLATIPYQGFQIVDPLVGKSTYEEGDITLARIDMGAKANVQVGETVHWLEIERQNSKALFQGGGALKIFAEGSVVKVENQTALIEIKRMTDVKRLTEKSLISIPNEYSRVHAQFAMTDSSAPKVSTLMLSSPMYPTETKSTQSRPLLTSLASVASLVALLLLAF